MKTTLFFKQLDLCLQLLAFIIPAAIASVYWSWYFLVFFYLTEGTIQVVSCIINAALFSSDYKHPYRKTYNYLLVPVLITMVARCNVYHIDLPASVLKVYDCCIFIVGGAMAFWYMWFSYRETRYIKSIVNRKQYV